MPYAESQVAMIRLLRRAASSGRLVEIVSETMQYTATRFVRKFGLAATVDAIVGGDNVKQGRPNPETLLVALGSTGLSPRERCTWRRGSPITRWVRTPGCLRTFTTIRCRWGGRCRLT